MGRRAFVEQLGKHRHLALATVLAVMAGQEVFEIIALEWSQVRGIRFSVGILLHLAQILAIVAGAYVLIKAFREKAALAEQERQRSSELTALLVALREKEEALAGMMERLTVVQEEERRIVAYDIHDCVAQLIVSAKQHLDTVAELCQCRSPRTRGELQRGIDLLDRTIVETRRLLRALRPGILDSLGLVPALRALLEETAREGSWEVQLVDQVGDERLPTTVETAAYRIVQEALANALKHARATRVSVAVRRERSGLVLEVRDCGTGFSLGSDRTPARGLGLVSMRERAKLLGGQCRIESTPGEGTTVRATLPVPNGAVHAALR